MSDDADPTSLEARLHELWSAGRYDEVATIAVESYGSAVMGLQIKLLGDPVLGGDAFSVFCEDLWKGLPRFAWRSSLRTWCFTLARHAAQRVGSAPARRAERNQPLDRSPVFEVAERVRTRTLAHLRTESKDELRALRASLSRDDQLLLTLRIEQQLPWRDIAAVTLGDVAAPADEVKREAARVRKRFQLVKQQLKKLAAEHGLLSS